MPQKQRDCKPTQSPPLQRSLGPHRFSEAARNDGKQEHGAGNLRELKHSDLRDGKGVIGLHRLISPRDGCVVMVPILDIRKL